MSVLPLLAALAIVSPRDGTVVSAQKPLRLVWDGSTNNVVYLLAIAREGADPQVFSLSNRVDAWIANLEVASRFDWSVRLAGSIDSAAAHFVTENELPRRLFAEGVAGFRDLGGWRTDDGRLVRQGRLLRSAALRERVTAAGISTLRTDFAICTDLDLRPARDVLRERQSVLGEDVQWKSIPFESGRRMDDAVRGREQFAKVFGLLTAEKSYPVLFEDADDFVRSDTLAFLLNGLLGVSEEDLLRNWSSSQSSFDGLKAWLREFPGTTLKSRIAAYAQGCGIDASEIETFRSLMLEEKK